MLRTVRGLALGLIAPLIVCCAASAQAKNGSEHHGTTTARMTKLHSLTKSATLDAEKDRACFTKFNGLLGDEAVTKYDVDPDTLMMSAQVTFKGQVYDLEALGISGVYAFGIFFSPPSQPLNAYGVVYALNSRFASPMNEFILVLDDETNCVLSN